jgi:hypothetical protein
VSLLAVVGALLGTQRTDRPWRIIVSVVACWIAIHLIFFGGARYRVPIHPFLILLAVEGWKTISERSWSSDRPRIVAAVLLIAALIGGWGTEIWMLTR